MTKPCPACRTDDLPEVSRFCLACGASLAGLPGVDRSSQGSPAPYTPAHLGRDVLTTRSALEGERKYVSVLLADVADSLAMAYRLDPEDIHQLMNGFFEIALDAVHGEQGTINQFRGDGFMALFGAPRARGDEALRAVRAAAALRGASEAYGAEVQRRFGVPFVLRMGIHCGTVWVGAIGTDLRRDYTAEGPTVGLAARLEESARPGEILISAEVSRQVGPYAVLRDLGVQRFRGVAEPTAVAEVTSVRPVESRLDVEQTRGLSRFVGREAELQSMARHFESRAEGAVSWVELRGDAGSGKSRLAFEYVRDTVDAGAPWLEGRCREADAARAFAVWMDLFRRRAEAGSAADAADKTLRLLAGDEGPRAPEAIASAVRSLLDEISGGQPVRLLLEDVEWLDPSSRRLVTTLLREPPPGGLRLIVTSRTDASVAFSGEGASSRIAVGGLENGAARAIAAGILGGTPEGEPLVALAVERAEGNPLFVEEVARSLRDGVEELRESARLEVAWRRAPTRVPDTLEGVIASRIDALADAAKRLLHSAAVIGRPFPETLLAAVESEAGTAISALLADLVERGLLIRQGEDFDFRHGLCREVAYRQILVARRRGLHAACARTLEEASAARTAENASEVGFHWDHAGEALPAVEQLEFAGRCYLDRLAAAEAVVHLRRAWELVAGVDEMAPGRRTAVGLSLVGALNSLDLAGEGAAVLDALDGDALAGVERVSLATACVHSGWVQFSERGDFAAGRRQIERGISLAAGDPRGLRIVATGHSHLVRLYHLDGSIAEAVTNARRVAEIATGAGDRLGVVLGRGNEGYVRCDLGEVRTALTLCEEAAALADEARNEVAIALAQAWLAKARVFAGDPDAARAAAERALRTGRSSGQVGAIYNAHYWEGEAWLLLGETRRALASFEEMARINSRWSTTLLVQARGGLETGCPTEARDLALASLDQDPPRFVRARALRLLGFAEAEIGDLAKGEERLQESISVCDALGLRPHVAEAQRSLAEIHAARGNGDRSLYFARRAIRGWRECGMDLHAELAEREFGSV